MWVEPGQHALDGHFEEFPVTNFFYVSRTNLAENIRKNLELIQWQSILSLSTGIL